MSDLTPAEMRALLAVAEYGGVAQAAHVLGKSARTIEQQLRSARQRLDADSTMQAYHRMREKRG